MSQYLPPNLLALFAPRDPIPFIPPPDKIPCEKKIPPYTGVAPYMHFEDPADTPAPTVAETRDERKDRKRKERSEQVAYQLEQDLALWDPSNNPAILGDPFKVLFVGRINYDTSESKLRREFENFGPIKRLKIVYNRNTGKPRGYAFIEYEHERDMHSAYKHADGKKIDGKRVLVDVERGRTIKGWRPRRLGGGLGGTRRGAPHECTKYSGREDSRRNRSRSRDRGGRRSRDRGERKPRVRSRSRDRKRRARDGEDVKPDVNKIKAEPGDMDAMQVKLENDKRRRKRSGSRERRRSRDREDRKDRRGGSRDRDRDGKRSRRGGGEGDQNGQPQVKREPERPGYQDGPPQQAPLPADSY